MADSSPLEPSMNLRLFLIAFLFTSLHAETPLIVSVPTESSRVPVYVSKTGVDNSPFSVEYAEEINKVLRTDLHLGGRAQIIKTNPQWEKAAHSKIDLAKWQNSPFHFAVIPQIKGDQWTANVLFLDAGQAKQTEPISLTGELQHDRQQIHRINDTLYRQLFSAEGIATTRIPSP